MSADPRPDLVALTDDGLVQLSNAGLVKRGLKDLAAGTGPDLAVAEDGVVSAAFADGTLTRLAPGKALNEATCTCPASGMCRHRVMLALSYRDRFSGEVAPEAEGWDPAAIDGEAFEASLPATTKSELARLSAARIDVRLERGAVPSARLPTATVRFLVPGDLDYARCDCAAGLRCAHVALALRAFKASNGAAEVSLGAAEPATAAGADDLLPAVDAALSHLLDVGLVAGVAAHAQTLAQARRASEAAGATQLTLALDALVDQIEAYEARSARHDEAETLALATELYARPRAGDRAMALGIGEPFETAMSKTRLVSLGARLRAEGDDIRAGVLFADSDTGATMLLEKLFSPSPHEAGRLADTVGRRQLAPGLSVSGAARGQILTSVGRRRADGLLALGSGASGKTALAPRDATFEFTEPLKARDAAALVDRFAARPPAFLRPRRKVDDVHVFNVAETLGQSWRPGAQIWQGAVRLGDGATLTLERAYDAAAPGALDILSAVFEGRHGALRQVAGTVRLEGGALTLDPWSIGAERFIVPDVDAAAPEAAPDLDSGFGSSRFGAAVHALEGAVHAGRRSRAGRDGGRLVSDLKSQGFQTAASRLGDWFSADAADVTAFGRAAVWFATLREDAR